MTNFLSLFGRPPTVHAAAPGRVNLIGEHTDYNGGYVLPCAIPQQTRVAFAKRMESLVRVWSREGGTRPKVLEYQLGEEERGCGWLDYVQGVTLLLSQEAYPLSGFDARLESDIPLGSGLSSSASLTVSLMRGLRQLFALNLDDLSIALLGQRVENEFVGARVGIMDPMAASLADEQNALFLDARNLRCERIPMPRGADLIVIHSGVSHNLAAGDYNSRRRECEQAALILEVAQLRDVATEDLHRVEMLPEPLCRRARHVVTENGRVLEAVAAMRKNDVEKLGQLFLKSHRSLRDDYEVSVPDIDRMVELAQADADIFGARLTGGGFGGSVVMLARKGTGARAAARISSAYDRETGRQSRIVVPM